MTQESNKSRLEEIAEGDLTKNTISLVRDIIIPFVGGAIGMGTLLYYDWIRYDQSKKEDFFSYVITGGLLVTLPCLLYIVKNRVKNKK